MTTTDIPELDEDTRAILDHLSGKPLDPKVAKRARAEAQLITDELRRQHGEMNIAVDLIREIHEE